MIPDYRDRLPMSDIFRYLKMSRSAFYYRPRERAPRSSSCTMRMQGNEIIVESNEAVVNTIEELLSKEFVCYGYKKVAAYLRNHGYLINRKKVRRL